MDITLNLVYVNHANHNVNNVQRRINVAFVTMGCSFQIKSAYFNAHKELLETFKVINAQNVIPLVVLVQMQRANHVSLALLTNS